MILSKRRSADENIGKLILFGITIIVALGLAGLVTYFYQVSKEKEIYSSVLLSVRSSYEDVNKLDGFSGCTYGISFNAITGIYNITGCTEFKTDIKGINFISATDTGAGHFDIKYKQGNQ